MLAYSLPLIDDHSFTTFLLEKKIGVRHAEAAINVVSNIANAVVTITSIAFSMTIVALVMASSQFGPRLLKNFMESKSTQFVLGGFTATYLFCLIVLSQIDASSETTRFPQTSVFIAFLLAIICIFALIFFIHHVATSIRADTLVNHVSNQLSHDLAKVQELRHDRKSVDVKSVIENHTNSIQIRLTCSGYIQAIDFEHLCSIATRFEGVIELKVKAGDFLLPDSEAAVLYSDAVLPSKIDAQEGFIIGIERTSLQDPVFAINKLVEMAVRALSPSLDDPFTATNCIDQLAQALSSFKTSNLPSNAILDKTNTVKIITNAHTLEDLFEAAFSQIRRSAYSQFFVMMHLLQTFQNLKKTNVHETVFDKPIKNQLINTRQAFESGLIQITKHEKIEFFAILDSLESKIQG